MSIRDPMVLRAMVLGVLNGNSTDGSDKGEYDAAIAAITIEPQELSGRTIPWFWSSLLR